MPVLANRLNKKAEQGLLAIRSIRICLLEAAWVQAASSVAEPRVGGLRQVVAEAGPEHIVDALGAVQRSGQSASRACA